MKSNEGKHSRESSRERKRSKERNEEAGRLKKSSSSGYIKLDDTEALKTIVGVVASGGATYLGSQVLAYGGGEPCYVALQGTSYASRFPKPIGVMNATKNVYKDTSEQIKKGIEGLQNTAKDILNMFTNP